MTAASEIPVENYRQILTWPFVLAPGQKPETWFKTCKNNLETQNSGWSPVSARDLLQDSETPMGTVGLYEEAVYFHDFIRSSLYPDENSKSSVAVYHRPELSKIKFTTVESDGNSSVEITHDFDVDLAALHVYRSGVAILTLELQYCGPPIALNVAQSITDKLRRAYPPFWFGEGSPALSPIQATLVETTADPENPKRTQCGLTRLKNRQVAQQSLVAAEFREPVFSWWRELLSPLYVVGNAPDGQTPLLRQVLDERIPIMTTMALGGKDTPAASLDQVTDGDWFRIAGADQPGQDPYPYNPCFLRSQNTISFYDRFMPAPGQDPKDATRFCFAGYHFAAVGAGKFFKCHVTQHTRRHYRHMQHLCLLEFATLISISQQLCDALRDRDNTGNQLAFRKAVLDTQERFMDFTHRHHFTGVSNQLQAREIFAKFRQSMELDDRYAEIKAELESATALVFSQEQRDATQEQRVATQAANNLTEIATVAAVVGLAAALTGMNVLFDEETELYRALSGRPGTCAGLAFDFAVFGFTLLCTTLGALALFRDRLSAFICKDLKVLGLIAFSAMVLGGVVALTNPAECPPPVQVVIPQAQ